MKGSLILAVAMAFALTAGKALACDMCGGKGNSMHVHGSIAKVDGAQVTIKANDKDGKPSDKEVTFETDAKTAVTVDGKEAKIADLKSGMACWVSPITGTAAKIFAKYPAPAK